MTILLLSFLAAAAPPQGEDVACILRRLTPEVRAGLIEEISSDSGTGSIEAVEAAAKACGSERGWTAEASDLIALRALASVMRAESEARLQRVGIPLALVDRWFSALPPGQQRLDGLIEASVDRLRAELVAGGVPQQVVDAHPGDVGFYISARIFEAELLAAPAP